MKKELIIVFVILICVVFGISFFLFSTQIELRNAKAKMAEFEEELKSKEEKVEELMTLLENLSNGKEENEASNSSSTAESNTRSPYFQVKQDAYSDAEFNLVVDESMPISVSKHWGIDADFDLDIKSIKFSYDFGATNQFYPGCFPVFFDFEYEMKKTSPNNEQEAFVIMDMYTETNDYMSYFYFGFAKDNTRCTGIRYFDNNCKGRTVRISFRSM